ncbi:glycosyltransferase family 4 protein [Halococcoides cellulosivorans]|uniref:Glycosyltransferase family 1 protein n=1 Tax=Halococcoides cellulosivorans TaxID=1679096 RepID=A0A2R4X020_9EURY|nr:glycosyltransferase family 4 protein [Halococcoides cellulosivorans]AWB27140.1 glycosyltransferase family 1 protein [Halococcoides cellulosivorans]
MRIAFLSNVVYPWVNGGAEKRIHEIGSRLAEDHAVTVYPRKFWDGPDEIDHHGMTLRAVAPETDLYVEEGRRSITEAIDYAARLTPPLRRSIDDHDVLVASVFPYFPVLAASLARLRTDTPLVTTWHEVWGEYWDDYLGRLAIGGRVTEHVTARVPQHPIAVSGVTADRLAQLGSDRAILPSGPDRADIAVVPNGIDVAQVRETDPADDPADVLYAGRLIADKRVDRLIDAFEQVASDATLRIVGDGPKRDELERQARRSPASDRIEFTGFLDEYTDVLREMRAAPIFASPSTREGFGITYVEAMAADCTVIGADHPESAAGEVIADAGFVPEPTTDALADTLDRALSGERPPTDPTARAAEYDWDAIARMAERAYRDAIG